MTVHGDYYNPANKIVYDGDTANAADLNAINSAVDTGLGQVATDLDTLETNTTNWATLAEAWASEAAGTNPDPLKPLDYSAYANAQEAEGWASSLGGFTLADGTASTENSAKEERIDAETAETNASASAAAALASETKANEWAEELEDTPVEPGEYSALHWAAKAAAQATIALGQNTVSAGTDIAIHTTGAGPYDFEVNFSDPGFLKRSGVGSMTGDLLMGGYNVRSGSSGSYPSLDLGLNQWQLTATEEITYASNSVWIRTPNSYGTQTIGWRNQVGQVIGSLSVDAANGMELYNGLASTFLDIKIGSSQVRISDDQVYPVSGIYDLGNNSPSSTWNNVYYYGTITDTSDIRLKKNVKSLSSNDVDWLYSVEPIEFKWKDEDRGKKTKWGFSAQDIYEKAPKKELSVTNRTVKKKDKASDPDDYNWGISAHDMIPGILKLVQDQRKTIDNLEARVATLEGN